MVADTLQKLDALDARRRAIESAIKPKGLPPDLQPRLNAAGAKAVNLTGGNCNL